MAGQAATEHGGGSAEPERSPPVQTGPEGELFPKHGAMNSLPEKGQHWTAHPTILLVRLNKYVSDTYIIQLELYY